MRRGAVFGSTKETVHPTRIHIRPLSYCNSNIQVPTLTVARAHARTCPFIVWQQRSLNYASIITGIGSLDLGHVLRLNVSQHSEDEATRHLVTKLN